MKYMELRHLRSFLAVVDEGSISAAARRLHTAQPAISRQIQQLERSVGAPVFERTAYGVELTHLGDFVALEARHIVGRADGLLDEMRSDPHSGSGHLRVALRQGLGPLTSVVFAAFRAAYPAVPISVQVDDRLDALEMLAAGGPDAPDVVIWGLCDDANGSVRCTEVYREPIQLAVAADSELGHADAPIDPEAVLDHPFVDLGAFMNSWAGRAMLTDWRNGEPPPLVATDALDRAAARRAVVENGALAIAAASGPTPRGIRLIDLATPVTMATGTVTRAKPPHPAKSFSALAAAVGAALHDLAPNAVAPVASDG